MQHNFAENKSELKFTLEAMTKCAADCAGCGLPPEVKARQNFWTPEQLQKVSKFINLYVQVMKEKINLSQVNITLGQGDFFQLKEKEVRSVMDFLNYIEHKHLSTFITASAITNYEFMKKSVDFFHGLSIENQKALLVEIVLDSSKLMDDRMNALYKKNISYIVEKFGLIEFAINVGEDTLKNITPKSLHDFMLENSLPFIAVNSIVSKYNQEQMKNSWTGIIDWLKGVVEHNQQNYNVEFSTLFTRKLDINQSYVSSLQNDLYKISDLLRREIFISHDGDIAFQQNGLGAVGLSSRNGFSDLMNIFNSEFDLDDIRRVVDKYSVTVSKKIFSEFTKHDSCAECQYRPICHTSAIAPLISTLANEKDMDSSCPVGIKSLIEKIETNKNFYHGKGLIYAQKDFASQSLCIDDLEAIKYKNCNENIDLGVFKAN